MSLEYEAPDESQEAKDYTKWWWTGVIVVAGLLAVALLIWGAPNPNVSMVRAKHILIRVDGTDQVSRQEARRQIEEIRQRIIDGEDFGELARQYSQDPFSSSRGGDLGWQQRGTFATEFEQHVWRAPLNTLSDVVETSHGFHLIVVRDRHIAPADEALLGPPERQQG